jgi:hypothetical protein
MTEPVREVEKKASFFVTIITWVAAIGVVVALCALLYSVWRQHRPY